MAEVKTPKQIIADAKKKGDQTEELEVLRAGIEDWHKVMQDARAKKFEIKQRILEIEGPAKQKTRRGTTARIGKVADREAELAAE